MNIRIIDKEAPPVSDRQGEVYELYLKLLELKEDQPSKKAVVTFTSKGTGLRWQGKLLDWAHEDGYQLFASAVPGTNDRQLYLEAQGEE